MHPYSTEVTTMNRSTISETQHHRKFFLISGLQSNLSISDKMCSKRKSKIPCKIFETLYTLCSIYYKDFT